MICYLQLSLESKTIVINHSTIIFSRRYELYTDKFNEIKSSCKMQSNQNKIFDPLTYSLHKDLTEPLFGHVIL